MAPEKQHGPERAPSGNKVEDSTGPSPPSQEAADLLKRLLDHLERHEAIPFLGAGISVAARPRFEPSPEHGLQINGGSLYTKLARAVIEIGQEDPEAWAVARAQEKRLPVEPISWPDVCTIKDADGWFDKSANGDDPCRDTEQTLRCQVSLLRELGGSPLARLSEIVHAKRGPVELCNILHIDRFQDLEPTLAHLAIAAFILEGVFREVITLNYDTCLEEAFRKITGDPGSVRAVEETTGDQPTCQDQGGTRPRAGTSREGVPGGERGGLEVVVTPWEYMGTGFQSSRDSRGAGRSAVVGAGNPGKAGVRVRARLYKLNGCARRWAEFRKKAQNDPHTLRKEADRIILTERQLQSFRGERWAEEMFRDRARRCHLLFSGFGSEEPQIRHTVLAVTREFRNYAPEELAGGNETEDCWDLPAAPWMLIYSEGPSFYQTQLLWGWEDAWTRRETEPPDRARSKNGTAAGLRNMISGKHASFFRASREKVLPADDLWVALLHGWWKRRFVEEFASGQVWARAFSPFMPGAGSLARELACCVAKRLFEEEENLAPRWRLLGPTRQGKSLQRRPGEWPLMRLWGNQTRYVPFRERPTEYAVAMFLLALFPEDGREENEERRPTWQARVARGGILMEYRIPGKSREPFGATKKQIQSVDRVFLSLEGDPRGEGVPVRERATQEVENRLGAGVPDASTQQERPVHRTVSCSGIRVRDVVFGPASRPGGSSALGFMEELGRTLATVPGARLERQTALEELRRRAEDTLWHRVARARARKSWRWQVPMVREGGPRHG